MPSHVSLYAPSHRFVFIHNFKTGGTSVRAALTGAVPGLQSAVLALVHSRMEDTGAAMRTLGMPPRPEHALMFVRNPWERLVSWYCMIRESHHKIVSHERAECQSCKTQSGWQSLEVFPTGELARGLCSACGELSVTSGPSREPRFEGVTFLHPLLKVAPDQSFTSFLRAIASDPSPTWYTAPQVDLCTDLATGVRLATVGRFESLETDLNSFLRARGLGPATVPHKNRTVHAHYATFYTGADRELVARWFARDISEFGYSFGG